MYTLVYCLGTAEQLLTHASSLLSQRAFYAVRKGECVLISTPYRAQNPLLWGAGIAAGLRANRGNQTPACVLWAV